MADAAGAEVDAAPSVPETAMEETAPPASLDRDALADTWTRGAVSAQGAASRALANRVGPTGRSAADLVDAQAVSWDERADVLEVYQHIEMIGSGVEQGWEPPAVPLEMLPQQDGEPDLHPAGERRNPKP